MQKKIGMFVRWQNVKEQLQDLNILNSSSSPSHLKRKVYFHDLLLSARLFNIRISAVDFSCLLQSISLVTRSGWAWHPDDLLNVTQWPDDDLLITVSHPWVRPPPSPEGPNGASRSQFHDLLDGFLLKSEQEHVIAGTEASRCSATSCRNSSGEQKLPGD